MKKKKKLKVEVGKDALKNIPEEDREGLIEQIKEMFGDMDEMEANSVAVEPLADGVRECPYCSGKLIGGPTFRVPPDNRVVQIFHCAECDRPFEGKPLN